LYFSRITSIIKSWSFVKKVLAIKVCYGIIFKELMFNCRGGGVMEIELEKNKPGFYSLTVGAGFFVGRKEEEMRSVTILLCLLLAIPCFGITITVDDDGPADFSSIQDAIDHSVDWDVIEVSMGTYSEYISFSGKEITVQSLNPYDPNVVGRTVITPAFLMQTRSILFEWNDTGTLRGFTISGGGIYCYGSSPTIEHNIIMDCSSVQHGGAIQCENNSAPYIANNIIRDNVAQGSEAYGDPSAYGGAISNCQGAIVNNIIINNSAISQLLMPESMFPDENVYALGGALYNCSGQITNNVIAGNLTMYTIFIISESGDPIVFQDFGLGGGLYECNGQVKNNIITYNVASNGGGIYGPCQSSYNTFYNNFVNNFAGGATAGAGDAFQNPLFADSGYWTDDSWTSSDFHLKSEAGRWDPVTRTWFFDSVSSPCIDAGDQNDSLGMEPNPNGGRINIGVYGGTAEASKSPSGIVETVCSNRPAMDSNGDCKVDITDFAAFAFEWLACGLDPQSACLE
jgi:hypothetical protein